jgi:hypothetical protein
MLRVVAERGDSLFNTFRRDRSTPEKGTETVLGLDAKLAIAGRANITSYAKPVRRIQMRPTR